MIDLYTAFERATDRIESPDLASAALVESDRRRLRRRSALAVTAAAASVALVVGVSQLGSGGSDTLPPVDTPSPSVPTPTPTNDADPATQPLWDPFDLVDAPLRSTGLPSRLEPPAAPEAGTTALQPMPGVVVAWPQEDADLRLLGTDGRWRTVPQTRDAVQLASYKTLAPAISYDGTQVAMSTDDGILVIDVTTGEDRTIAWPAEIAPPWAIAPELRWLPGDEGVVALDGEGAWFVSLDGTFREAPYRGWYPSLAVDPEGPIYQNAPNLPHTLLTWEDDEVVHEAPFIQCQRMVAAHGLVSCTAGSLQSQRSGPVVVDATTGDVIAYAPIKDRTSIYADNGYLSPLGFLDEDTVLLLVGAMDFKAMDFGEETWHLVAWQFRTGALERITSGDTHMRGIAVAPDLVE